MAKSEDYPETYPDPARQYKFWDSPVNVQDLRIMNFGNLRFCV